MSKLDLSLELDQPNKVYAPGGTVSGRIKIQVNQEVTCESLKLYVEWFTRGRGSRDGMKIHTITFEEDVVWHPGTLLEYPFEFQLTSSPASYEGKNIKIKWQMTAEVDFPRAIDRLINVRMGNPKVEQEILVVPEHDRLELHTGDAQFARLRGGRFRWLFFLVPFIIVGLAFLDIVSFGPVILLLLVGAVVYIGQAFLRQQLAQRRFDSVEVEFDQLGLTQMRGRITPLSNRSVMVQSIKGEFQINEVAVDRSGTSSTTYRHIAYSQKTEVPVGREISNFEQSTYELIFDLPETPPNTFDYSNNDLRWEVFIEIPISRFINWKKKFPITVTRAHLAPVEDESDEDFGGGFEAGF